MSPIITFHRSLKARHGDVPAGHLVEVTTVTSELNMIAIACAWIQRGTSYFVRTCRSAEVHEGKYLANFEDYFGNFACKEINRP